MNLSVSSLSSPTDTVLLYDPIICRLDENKQPSNIGLSSIPLAYLDPFLLQLKYSFAEINLN